MPRAIPPPTPGSSSDIRGQEKSVHAVPPFHLPQTAYTEADRRSISSATPSANGSDSSYRPVSPTSPVEASRKRAASQSRPVITKDDFALPPPPTRSRKIIQMKPRESEQQGMNSAVSASPPQTAGKSQAQTGSKRKQNNAGTTAAGRKMARKTAHSLIERRRRSKMNEEFGVLKDMIPACKGQEMHKLAILQASIEYLRYLEQCVSDLQAKNHSPRPPPPTARPAENLDDDEDEDEEMEHDQGGDDGAATPATTAPQKSASLISLPSLSQITTTTTTTTTSPSVFSIGAGRHYSISSATSSYSPYFHSNQASPAFGPQLHHVSTAPSFSNAFGLGSPALKPFDPTSQQLRHIPEGAPELSDKQRPTSNVGRREHELDQEATAALLMLNHDRRAWTSAPEANSSRSNTGMSVRDLLSG